MNKQQFIDLYVETRKREGASAREIEAELATAEQNHEAAASPLPDVIHLKQEDAA